MNTAMTPAVMSLLSLVAMLIPMPQAWGYQLDPGTILASDQRLHALVAIDPATGDRTVISGAGVGTGPEIALPSDIAVSPIGTIYLADSFYDLIFSIDPNTGNRTVIASDDVGSGVNFSRISGMELIGDGTLLAVDRGTDLLCSVDPVTGARTIISANGGYGDGPLFTNPVNCAVDSSGNVLIANGTGLYSVDPTTGDRTLISGQGVGGGPEFTSANNIDTLSTGEIVVAEVHTARVFLVDPATGDRTVLSGGGPNDILGITFSVAVDAFDNIIAASFPADHVVMIDSTTGAQTLLSDDTRPPNDWTFSLRYITVVPFLEAILGDVSGDGFVDVSDLDLILAHWGDANTPADLDNSGVVDDGDLDIVIANWGNGTPPGNVPEPGTAAMLTLGVLALCRRRRHHGG